MKEKNHPRLYFGEEDIPVLKARMERSPGREIWEAMMPELERAMSWQPPEELASLDFGWVPGTCERTICLTAFAYLLTGKEEYAEQAKRLLLWTADLPTWCGYPHGGNEWKQAASLETQQFARAVAVGYDWLYTLLSEDERRRVRQALLEKALRPITTMVVKGGIYSGFYSNWSAAMLGGIAIAALAIQPELDPADWNEDWIELPRKFAPRFLDRFGPDGEWCEGLAYWNWAVFSLVQYTEVTRRLLGHDLYSHPHLIRTGDMGLHLYTHDLHGTAAFNDCAAFGMRYGGPHLLRLASQYRDGHLQWLWQQVYLAPGDDSSPVFPASPFDFIWLDETVTPQDPEDLPRVKHFYHWGTVAARSGWKPNDAFLALHCAPFRRSHDHADRGTYVFNAHGQRFVIDPGLCNYIDPEYYREHFWSTQAHNVILAGERGQDFDNDSPADCHIQDLVAAPGMVSFLADATGAYSGIGLDDGQKVRPSAKLERWWRRVFFLEDYVIMWDEIAQEEESTYTWLLHGLGEIEVEGAIAICRPQKDGADMVVQPLRPEGAELRLRTGYISHPPKHHSKTRVRWDLSEAPVLEIVSPRSRKSEEFVNLLYPRAQGPREGRPNLHLLVSPEKGFGAHLRCGSREETFFWQPRSRSFQGQGLKFVGRMCLVARQSGQIRGLRLASGRELKVNGQTWLEVKPGSGVTHLRANYYPGEVNGEAYLEDCDSCQVRLRCSRPATVEVPGQAVEWDYDAEGGLVTFTILGGLLRIFSIKLAE